MSLLDSVALLDVRNLTPGDAARVTAWAAKNPPGRILVANAPPGANPWAPSWFALERLGYATLFQSHAQREGVEVRFVVDSRLDVIAPTQTRYTTPAPGWARHVARSPAYAWRDALGAFTAAGFEWAWPSGFGAGLVAELAPDAAVYVSSPTLDPVARRFTLGGVVADLAEARTRAWIVDQVAAAAEYWRAEVLVDLKPWERFGAEILTPATPAPWSGGFVQPSPFARGEWELAYTAALPELHAALGAKPITLTRPPTPPAVHYLGDATASAAVLGEAALIQWL